MGVFYSMVFATGVFAGRKEKGAGSSSDSFLLAGRAMPLWIGAFTMTATWVGGGYINGTAEAVYSKGLLWLQAPWGFALSLIIGGLIFAKPMRRGGNRTFLDVFQKKYGERTTAVLFIAALTGELFWSAAILAALGTTFGVVLNIDYTWAIVISACIAIAYTMMGGFWSVAYTDVIQLIFVLVGLVIAVPFVIANSDGIALMWSDYVLKMPESFALTPWTQPNLPADFQTWVWIDFALLLILGGIPWQVYFQRVLACKTDRHAVQLSIVAGIVCLLMAIPPIIIGMGGALTNWDAIGVSAPKDAALILPYMLRHTMPIAIAAIGLGAVAAAVMSSVDSSILSASSMFVVNVYRPLVSPKLDGDALKKKVRWSVFVIGGVATLLALKVRSVYVLWFLCADLVYVILFPQLVMALFYRKATVQGALAGAGVGFAMRLLAGEASIGLPSFWGLFLPADFPFRTAAMLCSLLAIWLVSLATYRHNDSADVEVNAPAHAGSAAGGSGA